MRLSEQNENQYNCMSVPFVAYFCLFFSLFFVCFFGPSSGRSVSHFDENGPASLSQIPYSDSSVSYSEDRILMGVELNQSSNPLHHAQLASSYT